MGVLWIRQLIILSLRGEDFFDDIIEVFIDFECFGFWDICLVRLLIFLRDFFAEDSFAADYCLIRDIEEGMDNRLDELNLFFGLLDRLLFFNVADFFFFVADPTGES